MADNGPKGTVVNNIDRKKRPRWFWPSFVVVVCALLGITGFYVARAATTTYSLFSSSDIPAVLASNTSSGAELGMKFTAKYAGQVTGVSFYKSAENTGKHVGSLWDNRGDLLASVTFSNETSSGWQTAMFTQPVKIAANVTYVIGYFAPHGHFSETANFFSKSAFTNGPLTGIKSSGVAHGSFTGHYQYAGNGVFNFGRRSSYPLFSGQGTNYWVDVLYNTSALSPSVAPAPPTSVTAIQNGTSIDVSWTAAQSSNPISEYQIYRNSSLLTTVSGTTLSYADSSKLVAATTYSYQVKTEDNTNTVSTASPTATVTYNVSPPPTTTTTTPAPTVTLSASANPITVGQSTTLSWSSTNATSCTSSGGWSGSRATSGTFSTGALSQTTTYNISCSGTSGVAATATITVTANAASTSPPTTTTSSSGLAVPSGFTSSEMTMDDQFGNTSSYSLLKNWNFAVSDNNTSTNNEPCTYQTWNQSGTAPYLGTQLGSNDLEYMFPQNVSQTSTGDAYNAFSSTGSGLTLTAKYTGAGTAGGASYTWSSGAVNTYNKAQIGGSNGNYFVQVRAEMPYAVVNGNRIANGSWAGIWLMPGCGNTTSTDYETDMIESGYIGGGDTSGASGYSYVGISNPLDGITTSLHNGGPASLNNTQQTVYQPGSDLSASYNTYGLDLNSATGTETFYFNGKQYAQYSDGPTGPMNLILDLQVAAPDTSSWHTTVASNSATETMNISEVQMYSSLK